MRFARAIDIASSIDAMRGRNTGESTTLDAPGTFRARGGADTVTGSNGNDKIWGGGDDDILFGDTPFGAGNDQIWGDGGRDLLFGRGGDDQLRGGGGRDQVVGEDGDDKLYGNAGNDFIFDGAGRDKSWGGKGRDVFHVSEVSGRNNQIKDFENGKDRISIDFEGVTFGDLNISQKSKGVLVRVKGNDDRVLIEGARKRQIEESDFGFNGDEG
ncbi:MAG: calcium-binding protein [Pseudomonadota bacterium]